jgi:hypothetical protein
MTITFESDSDVIIYALEKIISFARVNQYLFVANCAWWIAGITGLDQGLVIYIDKLEVRRNTYQPREISTTPRDITRSESIDLQQNQLEETIIQRGSFPRVSGTARTNLVDPDYISDPFKRTRKGRISPIRPSKNQLKKARQKKHREDLREPQLTRARIIHDLCKE